LGRDEVMVEKIVRCVSETDSKFVAIVGTPVPATIGTDYNALVRMLEKRIDIPVVAVETNGMRLSDEGEAMAYRALVRKFGRGDEDGAGEVMLGRTPMTYGASESKEALETVSSIGCNTVINAASAGAVEFAVKTGRKFRLVSAGEVCAASITAQKTLIVHDEVYADALRNELGGSCDIATFMMLHDSVRKKGDVKLKEEEDFAALVYERGYERIIADECYRPLAPGFKGEWIDLPHFAASGRTGT